MIYSRQCLSYMKKELSSLFICASNMAEPDFSFIETLESKYALKEFGKNALVEASYFFTVTVCPKVLKVTSVQFCTPPITHGGVL
jgi:hypothetical protein